MRSYWSRGASSLEEILEMLTEARDLGEELGDTEIRAEAMAWRVPTFVALVRPRRPRGARSPRCARPRSRPRSRSCSTSPSTTARRSRSATGASTRPSALAERSHEWSRLLTGRDASGVYGIQMFSVRREQGRLAELAPVIRLLAGESAARRAVAARARRACSPSSAWTPRRGASSRGSRADGLDALPRVALARLAHLPRRTRARRSATRRRRRSSTPSSSRSPAANVMIGHLVACYGAADRYLGMLAATLGESERADEHFERALELNRRMGAATWLAHTAYEYGRFLLARGAATARGSALLGEAAALAGRIGMPTLARAGSRRSAPAAAGAGLPDGLSPREVQILAPRRPRPQQPRDRQRRSRSASTRPRTTSAASCARPAAPTAPRPRRTRTGIGSLRV